MRALGHLGDSIPDAIDAIRDGISLEDFKAVESVFEIAMCHAETDGKIYDLLKYREGKKKREIQEEIKDAMDQQIKKKQKIYTEVWNHNTVAGSLGRVDGMYCLTKKLRDICG